MDFSEKVAIVTGSSSGIGAAAAIGIAEGGGKVVVNYSKSEESAANVVNQCVKAGGDAIAIKADISRDEDCRNLVSEAVLKWGRLDILVNNAGRTKFVKHSNLEGLTNHDFEEIYGLNAIGPFQLVRAARKYLSESGSGSIVNVSSVAGIRAVGSSLAYASSKAALNSLTVGLARALGEDGIRVNAVCPGFVGTDWFRKAFGEEKFNQMVESQESNTPLGRAGRAADIKGPILFFASKFSEHTTGQLLVVDAGFTLGMPA